MMVALSEKSKVNRCISTHFKTKLVVLTQRKFRRQFKARKDHLEAKLCTLLTVFWLVEVLAKGSSGTAVSIAAKGPRRTSLA